MSRQVISLRKRFMGMIILFATAYLILAIYTDNAARQTLQHSDRLSNDIRDVGKSVSAISDTLHLMGIAMYQSTLYDREDQPELIEIRLEQLARQVSHLLTLRSVKNNPELYDPAMGLAENLQSLTIQAQAMLEIQSDFERKYPAMPIMLGSLQPINKEFMGLLMSAISESNNNLDVDHLAHQEEALSLFRDLRYVWSQLVSSVRVFVANRMGAFGPPEETMNNIEKDRELYSTVVGELLVKLEQLNNKDQLDFIQANALPQLKKLHDDYEYYFRMASLIYHSESWRADKTLLREEVDPALDNAWTQIYLIHNRINAYSQVQVNQFAHTADNLSNYIWLATAVAIFLMLIAYVVFEFLIREPIVQVAQALEAEGKGEHYQPKLNFQVSETSVLVDAFSHMQAQVRSRQLRLQTILDNAGEGILTIDKDNKIKSFNQAAEALFGFDETDVIDTDIAELIPSYNGIAAQQRLSDSEENSAHTMLNSEHEVLGQRKNGRMFPLSLRLGQVEIENELLYTALVSDISERKAMIDRLTQLAERDSLTGLYNRHFLMDELERIVDRSARGETQSMALLYLDLDNFKYVNDTLGHLAGDKVLQEVTTILAKRARGTDLITRLGGDEFAILIYDVDASQARLTAEAYRKQLMDYMFRYEAQMVDIGCSIGVTLMDESIVNKEDLLAKADLACHIAKRSGRNCVHVYESEDRKSIDIMTADMGWSRRIKSAIENDEFILVSQPIFDVFTHQTFTNEILLRLKDDVTDNVIMPAGFLPSAERFGLAIDVDRWVIRNSFKLMAERKFEFSRGISINLSAKSLCDSSTLDYIKEQLIIYQLPPENIIFEVTENSAISHLSIAAEFLTKLKKIGFVTALDDFGVGYSSFTYLKDLPVDIVKIDGSFVQNLNNDPVKNAIIMAMNDVVHAMGKKTVAEFVEDQLVLDQLRSIGVDYCQGYYTGRPGTTASSMSNVVYLRK